MEIIAPKSKEVIGCEGKRLRRCILAKYKLDIYAIDHGTISEIRRLITMNIIDSVDYISRVRRRNAKVYNGSKSSLKKCSPPTSLCILPDLVMKVFDAFGDRTNDDEKLFEKLGRIGSDRRTVMCRARFEIP